MTGQPRSILLETLNDRTRQLFELLSKNGSFDEFLSADRGFGRSRFFKNRSNKSIYEPISKRIVDSERPRHQ